MARKIALVVGMSDHVELPRLNNARRDAQAMAQVLREVSGFEVEEHTDIDHARLAELIELLFAEKERDDLVLFYFSGHGIKDERGQLHLAAPKTRRHPSGELVRASAVACRHVHEAMTASRSRRQVVILDCCFSGAFAEGMQAKDSGALDLRAQLGGEGRAVLASSSSMQYSFDPSKESLSTYTQQLVRGITTGEADLNHDGDITIEELHEYARSRVQQVNPAMQPQMLPIRDGFKIILGKAPQVDARRVYAAKVQEVADRSGTISQIARQVLALQQQQLQLPEAETRRIEAMELAPLRERAANREKLRTAVRLASERGTLDEERHILEALRVGLGLSASDLQTFVNESSRPRPMPRSKSPLWLGAGLGCFGLVVIFMLYGALGGASGAPPTQPDAPGAAERPEAPKATPSEAPKATPPVARPVVVDDSRLDEVLRVDHSQTAYAIRITADNTLGEAKGIARAVLQTSRFQPWIVHQAFGKGLFMVYVGDYSSSQGAASDRLEAREVRGVGAIVVSLREECPRLEWNSAGYHECSRF